MEFIILNGRGRAPTSAYKISRLCCLLLTLLHHFSVLYAVNGETSVWKSSARLIFMLCGKGNGYFVIRYLDEGIVSEFFVPYNFRALESLNYGHNNY